MRIARVFPTQTSMSPCDRDAYFGIPDLFTPEYDHVHISVAFTWDIEKAHWLAKQWEDYGLVKIGGPAIDGELPEPFTPGKYLRKGVIITSRGCPNQCPWCFIKNPLKELEVHGGSNIVDNNFLACSEKHKEKVFQMLKKQRKIIFSGGLEASRINDKVAEQLRGLRIDRMFTAYDTEARFKDLERAAKILKKYFTERYLYCYVLIGFKNDSLDKAEGRLRQVWELGLMPFAMRYRKPKTNWDDIFYFKERAWNLLARKWSRPALIRHQPKI